MVQARNVFLTLALLALPGTRLAVADRLRPPPQLRRRYPRRGCTWRTMAAPVSCRFSRRRFQQHRPPPSRLKMERRQTSMTSRSIPSGGLYVGNYLQGTVDALHPAVLQCQRVLVLHNGRRESTAQKASTSTEPAICMSPTAMFRALPSITHP